MIRAPALVIAIWAVSAFLALPAAAQSTGTGQTGGPPAPGSETHAQNGDGKRPDTSTCDDKNATQPCPPRARDQPAGGNRGIYLPPLLADLLGGGSRRPSGPGQRATDPGPRPPKVGAGVREAGPTPPRPTPPPAPVAAAPPPPPLNQLPRPRPRATSGAFVAGEVVAVVDGDRAVADAIAAANALEVLSVRGSALVGGSIVRFGIPDGRSVGLVLAQLEADGRAGRPEPNSVYSLQQMGALPQYAFERIALNAGKTAGKGVRVAVIDSAVAAAHPALAGVIAAAHDALPDIPVVDRDHGTSIVGLIAGRGAVRGAAPGAEVYHSRAFEGGQSTMAAVLRSLDWAAGEKVAIINLSFTGPYNRLMGQALDAARARGIVSVAAAGNAGPRAPRAYPAAFDSVIAVTATDTSNRLMNEANRGAYVFVAAPGVEVAAPVPGGIDFLTGTSMAAAILSGGIAGLIGEDGSRGPDWIEAALAATSIDLGPPGRDKDFGYGLANFAAARGLPEKLR